LTIIRKNLLRETIKSKPVTWAGQWWHQETWWTWWCLEHWDVCGHRELAH